MTDTAILQARYDAFCALGLHLDMSRGKPEPRQLDLSLPMLRMTDAGFACEDGVDARNYGDPTGIPEAKRLFGALLGMPPEQVIVGGNSSVNLIYDALVRAILHGTLPGDTPWKDIAHLKFCLLYTSPRTACGLCHPHGAPFALCRGNLPLVLVGVPLHGAG